jgi:hypothetical protein
MSNGTVSEAGTYSELVEQKGDFSEFLATYLSSDAVAGEYIHCTVRLLWKYTLYNIVKIAGIEVKEDIRCDVIKNESEELSSRYTGTIMLSSRKKRKGLSENDK